MENLTLFEININQRRSKRMRFYGKPNVFIDDNKDVRLGIKINRGLEFEVILNPELISYIESHRTK